MNKIYKASKRKKKKAESYFKRPRAGSDKGATFLISSQLGPHSEEKICSSANLHPSEYYGLPFIGRKTEAQFLGFLEGISLRRAALFPALHSHWGRGR